MKFTFAAEDTIIGTICGLLLIGFSGIFFSIKLSNIFYTVAFIIYSIFLLLDIFNELRDLTTHMGFIIFSLIHSFADLVIALAVISHFSKWSIPYLTSMSAPYLQSTAFIFWLGIFLVAGNLIWMMLYPFLD